MYFKFIASVERSFHLFFRGKLCLGLFTQFVFPVQVV